MPDTIINPPFAHLPIATVLDRLKEALRNRPSAVLVAPPGAGKTTVVPLALLDEPWLAARRILMLAPRRLAVRAAARRMATLLNQRVGQQVGYRVRLERRVGPHTRIEVVTEGILTRLLQRDPSLSGVGLVIFDEFHERSLDADLGLALCRDLQGVLNETLRLLVMSATLDPAPVADLLDGAALIRCDGRTYPVETRYVDRPPAQPVERGVAEVIQRSVRAEGRNILAFLPGAREIRRTYKMLGDATLPDAWQVCPLYGTLPRDRQDAALAPPPEGRRKIVLATSIAETSLTIDGIGVVVDGGLRRAPRFDPVSGMTRLVTLPVSRASADQRRGRAGRLGPGICYRLWREALHPSLPPYDRPEILDGDLAGLALELALWGVDDPLALGWLDPPPPAAFSQARRLLIDLDALDEEGHITPHGRQLADVPSHPRLAHMIISARQAHRGAVACDIAALLGERDPLHFEGRRRDADLKLRLEILAAFRAGGLQRLSGVRVDDGTLRRILTVAAELQRRLGTADKAGGTSQAARLLLLAYPDRVAQKRTGSPNRYLLSGGRGAVLDASDPLCASDYLVAAHLDGDRREARIFLAAAIDRQTLLDRAAHYGRWREAIAWDDQRQAVTATRDLMLGALKLSSDPLDHPDPEKLKTSLLAGIRKCGIGMLPWTRALRTWQARVNLLARIGARGGPWPDVADAALTETLDAWLSPHLTGVTRIKELTPADLAGALRQRLTWRQQQLLEELAPTHLTVPSGSRRPVDYDAPVPVLAVRIQEMFGSTRTPSIADETLPLMLHLLSPAGRPAQITRDLASFWQNGYPEVKKELKGRYPKHDWPDDPLSAAPTATVRRKRSN